MNPLWLSLATVLATVAGGLCALRLRARLHLLLGFTGGVLLGVVAFDLWPESLEQSRRSSGDGQVAMVALVAGFVLFHGLRRLVLGRHAHGDHGSAHDDGQRALGTVSTLALVGHSVMDGVGIGLGFQVSPAVGITVAIAVIAHDFCDGLNTVSLMLLHRHTPRNALRMLALDALAPVLGAASTLAFSVPPALLAPYLGFFAGFLLYIGVSDILPQAYSRAGPAAALNLAGLTGGGVLTMYGVLRWAG
ncbi:MAG TPA: ZIP family metal transporter [Burkholderiaceae bacterium]|nr:ZIP family metal transporter [Burkholderiaceae bacterium]